MGVDPTFWRDRRVIVTGHTGFKGSWLSLWLQQMGAELLGYSSGVPTMPSLYESAAVGSQMQSADADVRSLSTLQDNFRKFGPEVVFHLAAQSTVLGGYSDPVGTYETNVLGTVNVMEAIRTSGTDVRSVVVVTTDKVYRQATPENPHREDDALGGHDPYSSSKACAEIATAAYRAAYFMSGQQPFVATARAGNVVGGGDWTPNRLVPDMVRAFRSGRPASIRNPTHVRPWQHVLDPLAGYLLLAQRLWQFGTADAEAWNFGPPEGSPVSVAEVADKFVRSWADSPSWKSASVSTTTPPVESAELRLNAEKAVSRLGWSPRLDLDTAIRWTADWYRSEGDGGSARDLTLDQIVAYGNLRS